MLKQENISIKLSSCSIKMKKTLFATILMGLPKDSRVRPSWFNLIRLVVMNALF